MTDSGIYEDESALYLKFGGKIGVSVCSYGEPNLHCFGIQFYKLKNACEIGESVSYIDSCDETCPEVHLVFDKVESIDLLIDYLNKAKDEYK